VLRGDQRDARQRGREAGELRAARALAQQRGGEQERERRLGLQDDGGEAGGHPDVHRGEQQPELHDAERDADPGEQAPRDLRALHEEDEREGDEREAQRAEQQRRDLLQPDVDDDEVQPPRRGDGDGEERVAERHDRHGALRDRSAPATIP